MYPDVQLTALLVSQRLRIITSSVVIALGVAGLTYLFWKRRRNDSARALKSLQIKVVKTEEECRFVIKELRRLCEPHQAVGFDCEWVSDKGSRHPVAMIQLSSYSGYCVLFQVSNLGIIPQSLKEFLEDRDIYKIGVAPLDDAKYLFIDYGVELKSCIDLRHIVQICGYKAGGLAAMSKEHLNVIMDKSWRIRCSDWEAQELTEKQINYAATDAYVAIKMFVDLINDLDVGFLSRFFKKENHSIRKDIRTICDQFVSVSFKAKGNQNKEKSETPKSSKSKELKKYPHATRSKPLYHNCFLEAPDGELLCTCDNKKAQWYVEKQLADIVKEDPLTVRLRFEPAGRSVGDVGRYYTLTKENKCVVCGSTNSYIRKNVVPREYRKYFPEIMKDHSSHDVVLLCVSCHQRSNMADQRVRQRLVELCEAPLAAHGENSKFIEDIDLKKVRCAARALLYQSKKHRLPDERKKELQTVIMRQYPNYDGFDELPEDLLREAAEAQIVFENLYYESHGEKVVDYFMAHEGLLELEKIWRQHFLDAMNPKYMPELWSVKHNEERLKVRMKECRITEEELRKSGLSRYSENTSAFNNLIK